MDREEKLIFGAIGFLIVFGIFCMFMAAREREVFRQKCEASGGHTEDVNCQTVTTQSCSTWCSGANNSYCSTTCTPITSTACDQTCVPNK